MYDERTTKERFMSEYAKIRIIVRCNNGSSVTPVAIFTAKIAHFELVVCSNSRVRCIIRVRV